MKRQPTTDARDRLAVVAAAAAIVATLVLPVASASAREKAPGELPETPVEYERMALERTPELRTLYRRWQAARSEAKAQSSKWPQPKVGYRTFIDAWWHDDAAVRHRGTISQTFPWPGVLEESADPAAERAEAITHRFAARVLEVVFEVREILIDVARIDAIVGILEEQRAVYGDVVEIVEGTMETGEADYADLLRVNTAREKISDRIDALESDRDQRVADLRKMLDLAPDVELQFDFEDDDPLDVAEKLPNRKKLAEAARNNHPSLAARRSMAAAHRERAEYADLGRLPWPTLAVGVDSIPNRMATDGLERRTALMLFVSVPIPIFLDQYDHDRRQFEHQRRAELAGLEEDALRLSAEIDRSVSRIAEKRRRLKRYREELLPLARDATEQLLNKLETGERDVTDYLLSFEQELDLETNLVEFRAAIATERARLERLTGGAFEAFPDRPSPAIEIRDARETGETRE